MRRSAEEVKGLLPAIIAFLEAGQRVPWRLLPVI